MSQHRKELAAVRRIREYAPDVYAAHSYGAPDWMWRIGFRPTWLHRVEGIDVTGQTGGRNTSEFSFDFDDATFVAIHDDLLVFEHLNEVYFQFTKITDASLPALRSFENLKFINLQQTQMTSGAVREFDVGRPEITIAFFYDLTAPDGDSGDKGRSR